MTYCLGGSRSILLSYRGGNSIILQTAYVSVNLMNGGGMGRGLVGSRA